MVTQGITGSLVLLLKLLISKIHQNYCYINYILKWFWKWFLKSFVFQCDFDFQITTSKMIWILILNHLYLGDLILILKSSTYDDFAHLCRQRVVGGGAWRFDFTNQIEHTLLSVEFSKNVWLFEGDVGVWENSCWAPCVGWRTWLQPLL